MGEYILAAPETNALPAPGVDAFVQTALPIIGWGLLGTFAVILSLAVITAVFNKLTGGKKK